jgi:preprotein translocase subunit SecG
MEQLLMVLYVLLSAAIVGLILLQQGKGADMGASFGAGASQTVFGAAGTGNLLTRSTAILATLFFIASIGLAVMAKHKAELARSGGIPVPPAAETRDNVPVSPQLPQDTVAPAGSAAPADEIPAAPPADVPAAAPAGEAGEVPAPPAG